MKFTEWARNLRIENEYRKSLITLCDMFERLAGLAGGNQDVYVRSMSDFQRSDAYENFINSAVARMVTPVAEANMRTWREAAKKSTKGKMLYQALIEEFQQGTFRQIQNQIIENVSLIKTLPEDTAAKVVKDIADAQLRGLRARSIEKLIVESTSKHSRASARLIARTEVSKVTTAITKARSEQLDIRWYVWRTALDGDRVRKSHRNMEGVLVNWSEPPSPERLVGEKDVGYYHAGNIWNCRCYPEPLLEVDDVQWPHKVYHQGRIEKMGKNKFLEIM